MINIKKPHLYAFANILCLGVMYGVFVPSASEASLAEKQETPPAVLTVALTPAQATPLHIAKVTDTIAEQQRTLTLLDGQPYSSALV